MRNIDAIACLYFWTNRTNATFQCYDMYFDANRQPVTTQESQDARNVRTGFVDVKNGIFTVSYTRAFKTTDPSNLDYALVLGDN